MVPMLVGVVAGVASVDDPLTGVADEVAVGHLADVEVAGVVEAAEATGQITPPFRT